MTSGSGSSTSSQGGGGSSASSSTGSSGGQGGTGGGSQCGPQSAGSDGLVGYWNFDKCSAVDNSGNGYDGIVNGAPDCVSGIIANAYDFGSEVDENIQVNNFADLTDSLTISAWAKSQSSFFFAPVLTKGFMLEPYTLWLHPTQMILMLNWATGDRIDCAAPITMTSGQFAHVAATYDMTGGKIRLYLNGVEVGQCDYSMPLYSNCEPLYFTSSYPGGHEHLEGTLDEIRIYNRALSPVEILSLYKLVQNP